MRVNIMTKNGIKHKYTVENIDSAMDIIKAYAKENNFNYEKPDNTLVPINDSGTRLGIISFFEVINGVKHFKGSAFIWSK